MDFSDALRLLKQGKKIARIGWNGKGMYLYLTRGRLIPVIDWTGPSDLIRDDNVEILSHIDMKTSSGAICIGWLASQTDMLSDDWVVLE